MEEKKKFCTYIRVSTKAQGESGLSLESQLNSCEEYVARQGGTIIGNYMDVESGRSRTREGLRDAIARCMKEDATLVVAKLDRLARDAEFVFGIVNTGIQIYICDMPQINTIMLGVLAALAQYESELISERTTAALKVAKFRGTLLGSHNRKWKIKNKGVVEKWQAAGAAAVKKKAELNENTIKATRYIVDATKRVGCSWTVIAGELNRFGFKTPRGGSFHPKTVQRMYQNSIKFGS